MIVRVDTRDNVAVVIDDGGQGPPHKVALRAIDVGEAVIRYGAVIGWATERIEEGGPVRETMLELPEAPSLDELPSAEPPAPLERLEGYTFEGYRNADGTVATRNLLGITTTVQCVAGVVDVAARRIREELLPRYSNVDDVVALNHTYGCGVAINAPGAEIPIRTVRNLALNPNFGGETLVVSLGCEKLQPERLQLGDCGLVRLQDYSFEGMINAVLRQAEERLKRLNERKRVTCPAADLVVGVQCGGSDAFSGVTANPAVGFAADLLVRAGATVMFSEVTEVRDAAHLLARRAATPEVRAALIRELRWYDEYLARGGADRSANPTPGNKRGGLANIVEKALGSVAKSGTSALNAVVGPGERVTAKGLVFLATPASDFICGTLQLAAGMNVHVFTTGEGTPYGLAMAPVIKLSTRTALAKHWAALIDIDAGAASIEQTGWELFRRILAAASGERTAAERLGLKNDLALFNPAPVT